MNKKNIKKLIINRNTYRVLLGAFALSECISISNIQREKLPPLLSTGIEDSLNKNGNNINDYKKFKNIKELTIDAKTTEISDLEYFPNLRKLTILNYDLLDSIDKTYINNMKNLKEITLKVDYESIINNFDFSWSSNNQKINIVSKGMKNNDLEDLKLFNLFNYIEQNNENVNINYFNHERLVELTNWDKKINEVVKELNLDENLSNEDIIIKLVDYITEYYEYDELIKNKESYEIKSVEKKENYYNDNLIKNFVDGNKYAISSNYAALLSLLGNYTGVKIDYVTGKYGLDEEYSWCEYRKAIIDLLKSDNDIVYKNMKNELNNSLENMTIFQQRIYKNAIYDRIKIDNSELDYGFYLKEQEQNKEKTITKDYDIVNQKVNNQKKQLLKKEILILFSILLMCLSFNKKDKNNKIKKKNIIN